MRLYKKAAVCLLAAAMALSMFTACGGNDNPGGGDNPGGNNPGGGSSTVEPAPKPDEIVLPGDDGEEGDTPTKTPIAVESSKYIAYQNRLANASEYYEVYSVVSYDKNNVVTTEYTTTSASKNGEVYACQTGDREQETLYLKNDKDTYDAYALFRKDKSALKVLEMSSIDSLRKQLLPTEIWATKAKVNGTEYYAESFRLLDLVDVTVCFGNDGLPKYQISKSNSGSLSVTMYRSFQFGAGSSRDLCKMPVGTKKYTMSTDENDNDILTDEQGKKYFLHDDTMTVTDESGRDVTSQFKQLLDFFN